MRNLLTYAAIALVALFLWRRRGATAQALGPVASGASGGGSPTAPLPSSAVLGSSLLALDTPASGGAGKAPDAIPTLLTPPPSPPTVLIGPAISTTAAALASDPLDPANPAAGTGIRFTLGNPFYGTTGYYGNAEQVAAQIAGGAQSAGIPTGVLGPETYTRDPATGPVWTPPPSREQQETARVGLQEWMDSIGRFLPEDQRLAAERAAGWTV